MNTTLRLGLLGGGQLAQMLALAAHPLGIRTSFIDPATEACASPVARQIQGDWTNRAMLDRLAQEVDVVSFEFENVPNEALAYLAGLCPAWPPVAALSAGQDRLLEKQLFGELGIAAAEFRQVESLQQLETALTEIGLPAILKTRRQGYDGKGQAVIRDMNQTESAWKAVGERPCLLERLIAFEREVSIIAVRGQNGEIRCYPLTQNRHEQGILIESIAKPDDPMQAQAEAAIRPLLERLGYVGVLALELFEAQGQLLANEFAPRVHNSGHWTQNGTACSQFENHVRAVCGLPLGNTSAKNYSAMYNCIGQMPNPTQVLAIPGTHLHDYGKAPRPGRKLGHVNLNCENPEQLTEAQAQLRPLINNLLG